MSETPRRLETEIELDATPEQVWESVSTGPGMSTWFVPHRIDPASGESEGDFGGGQTQGGRVIAWEPGRRVVYKAPEGSEQDESGFALEFLVEGRGQSSTVLRLIQSGFSGDDWEQQYEGTKHGWDLFLGNLASYFTHFKGLRVTNVVAMGFTSASGAEVRTRFRQALDVPAQAGMGEQVTLTPDGLPPIEGVIDLDDAGTLGVRSHTGLHRFTGLGAESMGMVSLSHYFYGVDLDGVEATKAWQDWLTSLFPATA